MKLSARNVLKGRVVEVRRGQTTAHVRLDIGGGTVVTASITNEAFDELAQGGRGRLRRREGLERHDHEGLGPPGAGVSAAAAASSAASRVAASSCASRSTAR